MAPIKFEEQLKDKLEERNLQPSSESWAKLSERLDAEEKKTKFPWFWWMGIAAAVIITLTVFMQTLGPKNTEQSLPQVVEQEVKDDFNNTEKSNTTEIKTTTTKRETYESHPTDPSSDPCICSIADQQFCFCHTTRTAD